MRIQKLFERKSNIEAYRFSARQFCTFVGSFHDAGTTAGTDIKPLGRLLYLLRPGSDAFREFDTGFMRVTHTDGFFRHYRTIWRLLSESTIIDRQRRTEKDNCVANAVLSQTFFGLDKFCQDSQMPSRATM